MKKQSFESKSCSSEQFGDEFGLGNPTPSVSYAVILFGNVFLHLGMTQTTRPCWCSTVCMKKRSFGRISQMFQDFLTMADCIVCEFHFRKINSMWSAFDAWLNNRYGRLTHETRKHTNQTPNYNGGTFSITTVQILHIVSCGTTETFRHQTAFINPVQNESVEYVCLFKNIASVHWEKNRKPLKL